MIYSLKIKILIEKDIKNVNIIPKLLDILSKNIGLLKNKFLSYSLNVNLIIILNGKINFYLMLLFILMSELLFPIINNILKKNHKIYFMLFQQYILIQKYLIITQ